MSPRSLRFVTLTVLVTLVKVIVAGLWEGTAEVQQSLTGAQAYLFGGDVLDPAVTAGNPSFLPAGHFALSAFCLLIAQAAGIPFAWAIKLPAVLADVLIALILYRLPRGGNRAALYYLVNPVTFLLSAYHGQPHTVAVAGVVLALWAMESQQLALGGLALGLAASVRQHFAVLAGPLWWSVKTHRVRMALAFVLTILVVNGPLFTSIHAGRILAPGWSYGSWGYTMLLVQAPRVLALFGLPHASSITDAVSRAVQRVAPALYWGWAGVFLGWALWRSRRHQLDLWQATLFFLVGMYVMSPGFGIQWLLWAVPFWLVVNRRQAVVYSLLAGAFLAGSYWQWQLNAVYGVRSITANLGVLRPLDLAGIILVGALGLLIWAYCARAAWRLARAQ